VLESPQDALNNGHLQDKTAAGSNQKKKGDDTIHLVLLLYNSSYQKCIPKDKTRVKVGLDFANPTREGLPL
jgi:hypothetical protein